MMIMMSRAVSVIGQMFQQTDGGKKYMHRSGIVPLHFSRFFIARTYYTRYTYRCRRARAKYFYNKKSGSFVLFGFFFPHWIFFLPRKEILFYFWNPGFSPLKSNSGGQKVRILWVRGKQNIRISNQIAYVTQNSAILFTFFAVGKVMRGGSNNDDFMIN